MHTFAFVDIVGFTAYTARWGDAEGARLAVGTASRIRALLSEFGAEEVKTLGDGVLLRVRDAAGALRLAARLHDEAASGRLPRLRIGVETGPAVERDGDWYGATVNHAARLCEAARPGEVLAGAGTLAAAAGGEGISFHRRRGRVRARPLRAAAWTARTVAPEPATERGGLARVRELACPRQGLERAA